MKLLNAVIFIGCVSVVCCGNSPKPVGMLGFKLNQVVNYTDKATLQALGITKVEKNKDGRIKCEFKSARSFRKFNCGTLTIDPQTKQIYIITATVNGKGFRDLFELSEEFTTVYEIVKERLGGEWSFKDDKFFPTYNGNIGNGISSTVYMDNYESNPSCTIVVRNSDVIKKIEKQKLKKDVESFDW